MLVTNGSIVWDCLRVAIPQKQCVATKGLRVACLGTCIHGGVKIHHCRGQTSLSHLSPETRLGSLRSSCHVRDESSDVTIHGFQWIYICKIIIMCSAWDGTPCPKCLAHGNLTVCYRKWPGKIIGSLSPSPSLGYRIVTNHQRVLCSQYLFS